MEYEMAHLNLSTAEGTIPRRAENYTVSETSLDNDLHSHYGDKDPFNVYRSDIWDSLLNIEKDKPPLHFQSPQLEFRGTLVKQLRNLCQKLKYDRSTLHSAVDLLDRFMDSYSMQPQHLFHVAVACLSIAAKSDEESVRVPSLKLLLMLTGVHMTVDQFRRMEIKVGENVKWRLLTPTPVSFAMLLEHLLISDEDLMCRRPAFLRKFRKDGARLLREYLDLTLSDVRLKAIRTVDVGCACVACARHELGLPAWPAALAAATGRSGDTVAPVMRRLHKMKCIMESRLKGTLDPMVDQGYSSVHSTPNPTPPTSPSVNKSNTERSVNIDLTKDTPPATPGKEQMEPLDMSKHSGKDDPYKCSEHMLRTTVQPTTKAAKRCLAMDTMETKAKMRREL